MPWRSQFLEQGAYHTDPTFRQIKNISRLWCSTQPYDPRCKSEHGHLADIAATALAAVMLFVHWLYFRSTQSCLRAHDTWIKEIQKNSAWPNMLMTETPEGWMEAQETQKYCSLVQFSCNQGIAGVGTDPEKFFQAYRTRQEKKFTRLKFLEGDVICVGCKVKPWADSTVWVIASPIGLLRLFWTCF